MFMYGINGITYAYIQVADRYRGEKIGESPLLGIFVTTINFAYNLIL